MDTNIGTYALLHVKTAFAVTDMRGDAHDRSPAQSLNPLTHLRSIIIAQLQATYVGSSIISLALWVEEVTNCLANIINCTCSFSAEVCFDFTLQITSLKLGCRG